MCWELSGLSYSYAKIVFKTIDGRTRTHQDKTPPKIYGFSFLSKIQEKNLFICYHKKCKHLIYIFHFSKITLVSIFKKFVSFPTFSLNNVFSCSSEICIYNWQHIRQTKFYLNAILISRSNCKVNNCSDYDLNL